MRFRPYSFTGGIIVGLLLLSGIRQVSATRTEPPTIDWMEAHDYHRSDEEPMRFSTHACDDRPPFCICEQMSGRRYVVENQVESTNCAERCMPKSCAFGATRINVQNP